MSNAKVSETRINTTAERTTRIYVDIDADLERRCRMRALMLEQELHKRMTRKSYIEYLIQQDTEKVKGASLTVIKKRPALKTI